MFKNGCVITIGNFDGIHAGHRKLIDKTLEISKKKSIPSVAISFDPNPKDFFSGKKEKKIFSLKQKERAFKELGIDFFEKIFFDKVISNYSHEFFYNKIIKEQFNASAIVVGKNFFFGKDRLGNTSYLENKTKEDQIEFSSLELYQDVSSSLLRAKIERKEINKKFFQLLGREFFMIEGFIKKNHNQWDFFLEDPLQLVPIDFSFNGFFVADENPPIFDINIQKKYPCSCSFFSTLDEKTGSISFENTVPDFSKKIHGGIYLSAAQIAE